MQTHSLRIVIECERGLKFLENCDRSYQLRYSSLIPGIVIRLTASHKRIVLQKLSPSFHFSSFSVFCIISIMNTILTSKFMNGLFKIIRFRYPTPTIFIAGGHKGNHITLDSYTIFCFKFVTNKTSKVIFHLLE